MKTVYGYTDNEKLIHGNLPDYLYIDKTPSTNTASYKTNSFNYISTLCHSVAKVRSDGEHELPITCVTTPNSTPTYENIVTKLLQYLIIIGALYLGYWIKIGYHNLNRPTGTSSP